MLRRFYRASAKSELAEDEEIILFLRRHWMAMLPVFLAVAVLLLFPVVVLVAYSYFDVGLLLEEWGLLVSPHKLLFFFFASYLLFICFFFLSAWMQYYLDVVILTNQRLVSMNQVNIFERQVASTDLIEIQDVSSEVKGFLPSVFDYGRVVVQTAGEKPNFILEDVPHPSAVARQILIAAQGVGKKETASSEEAIKAHEEEALGFTRNKEEVAATTKGAGEKSLAVLSAAKRKNREQEDKQKASSSGEIDLS